jgi:hypothetical protein
MPKAIDMRDARYEFVRPIVVATALTLGGELLIFLFRGLRLFADGKLLSKFVWTATCGVAISATIVALTILLATGRLEGHWAASAAGSISFSVLAFCTFLCYRIDMTLDLFGARQAPRLFIAGGLVLALVGRPLYGWLLHSLRGASLLARIGL